MAGKQRKRGCGPKHEGVCCKVESVVSIDERGQMVLPKELREKAGIKAGDKLAIVTWGKGSDICCLGLFKADELSDMVRDRLGPIMTETDDA
jgi:antitoxin PrlF